MTCRFLKFNKCGLLSAVLTLLGVTGSAFANNVQVALEGELLVVRGDNLGNQFSIARNAGGDVIVTGQNGTRINQRPSVRFPRAILNSVEINTFGGDDIVTVNNLAIANDLYVNLGDGNDRLQAGSSPSIIGNNAAIEGGAGNETVRLSGWEIGSDLYVDGQAGSLSATLSGLKVGFSLSTIGDASRDVVTISNSLVGGVIAADTKGGNDAVAVSNTLALGFEINTDMGNDTVQLTGVESLEDIGIYTGTQSDTVTLTDVSAGKNITSSLDEGDDKFTGTRVIASLDAVFEGGFGTDTFTDLGVLGGTKTDVKEFEIFP